MSATAMKLTPIRKMEGQIKGHGEKGKQNKTKIWGMKQSFQNY